MGLIQREESGRVSDSCRKENRKIWKSSTYAGNTIQKRGFILHIKSLFLIVLCLCCYSFELWISTVAAP